MMVGWYAIKQEDSIDFKSYDNDDSNMIELRTVGFHELDELDDVSSSSRTWWSSNPKLHITTTCLQSKKSLVMHDDQTNASRWIEHD